jgi:eukaryotic-like serine/threonine-protein kinase
MLPGPRVAAPSLEPDTLVKAHHPAFAQTEVPDTAATLVKGVAHGVSSHPPEVDPAPAPLVEASFDARYEDRARLGEGGMGEVRLCKDQRIGREIAIKVIKNGAEGSRSDARVRFEREARVQGQLEHPSVVPVYDLGIRPDGSAFFTMKRVRGETLEEVLQKLRDGDAGAAAKHTRRRMLGAFVSLSLAVAFAHSRRVLHRDLKPGNIMLGAYGELYILDWGLAKVLGAPDVASTPVPAADEPLFEGPVSMRHRTVQGSMMGTPGYMSPEQIRGEIDALDERSDVFALGTILFEVLTLEPLFGRPGDTVTAVLAATLKGADARASVRAPDAGVPPELDDVCVRATARDPAERFATARELSEAVERFLEGDRDLEQRRAMAERHVEHAEALFTEAEQGGEGAARVREEALREASAALALDPGHRGAIGLMVRLLLDAPLDLPPEARAELEERAPTRDPSRRGLARGYSLFLAFAPAMLLLGVRDYAIFALIMALAVAAFGVSLWGAKHRWDPSIGRLIYVVSTLFIGFSSAFMGPFILVPSMVAGNTLAFVVFGERRDRALFIGIGVLGLIAPVALELLGLCPSSYTFSDAGMTVVPQVASFPRNQTLMFLLVANLTMVLTPALLIARIRDALAANEERLFAYAWRLRQLLPIEARTAALPGVKRGAEPRPLEQCITEIHERLRLRRGSALAAKP